MTGNRGFLMQAKGIFVGVALAMLLIANSAQAQSIPSLQRLCGNDDSKESMDACTAIIEWSHGRPAAKKLAEAYTNRGNIYADKGETDKAIADFTHAINLDPTRDDAFAARGVQYYNQGDYKHAVADFDAAIRLDPSDADDWAWRSRAKGHLGDADGANADLVHALELNPGVEQDMSDEQ
jgi:tetratricopeptide (TPR) repeat protein